MSEPHWSLGLVGLPWSVDFHCWTLVQQVYAQRFGIALPDMQYDALSLLAAIRAFGDKQAEYAHWVKTDIPVEGSVVVMAIGSRPRHVGVWVDVDGGMVLHNLESSGVILSSVEAIARVGFRVTGFFNRARDND